MLYIDRYSPHKQNTKVSGDQNVRDPLLYGIMREKNLELP